MDIFHDICPDDSVKISFHEIEDQVYIFVILCFQDILKGNYVGMTVELLKEDDLGYYLGTYR